MREMRGRAGCLGVVGMGGEEALMPSPWPDVRCKGDSLHVPGEGGHRIALGALLRLWHQHS